MDEPYVDPPVGRRGVAPMPMYCFGGRIGVAGVFGTTGGGVGIGVDFSDSESSEGAVGVVSSSR